MGWARNSSRATSRHTVSGSSGAVAGGERVRGDKFVVDDKGASRDSESRTWWRIGPGDEDFLTQTIQVHFVELRHSRPTHGHGHQNEAAFYILEGHG